MVPYVKGSVAKERKSILPLASRCRIGFWSGTRPLVKSRNASARLWRSTFLFSGSAGELRWQIEANASNNSSTPSGFHRFRSKHKGGGSNCDA
jgi:hypothetical protein